MQLEVDVDLVMSLMKVATLPSLGRVIIPIKHLKTKDLRRVQSERQREPSFLVRNSVIPVNSET